jgi:hypothetical protein
MVSHIWRFQLFYYVLVYCLLVGLQLGVDCVEVNLLLLLLESLVFVLFLDYLLENSFGVGGLLICGGVYAAGNVHSLAGNAVDLVFVVRSRRANSSLRVGVGVRYAY